MTASVKSAASSPKRPLSPSSKSGKANRKSTLKKKEKDEKKSKPKVPEKRACVFRKRTKKEMQKIAKHYTRLALKITKEAIKLAEHLQNWVDKNARPKKVDIVKLLCKREPSRWAKRGPMTQRDWVRFYTWAEKNAVAKGLAKPPEKPEPPKKKKLKPGQDPITLEERIEHWDKLSEPKQPRKKYEYPPPPDYPYSPQIGFKQPAKKDRGRPFPKPRLPRDFQHIYNELDFWRDLRFPVRVGALNYVPSQNIEHLALPRIVPPITPHCPIPEKPAEYVEPRRRMSHQQWVDHRRRLKYLAAPMMRTSILDDRMSVDLFIW